MHVFDTPGHTRGHITLWFPEADALFPGEAEATGRGCTAYGPGWHACPAARPVRLRAPATDLPAKVLLCRLVQHATATLMRQLVEPSSCVATPSHRLRECGGSA